MDGRWRWNGDDALQMDQLSILEHGRDRLAALHADAVISEPAERPRGAASQQCSWGLDYAEFRFGKAAHASDATALPLSPSHSAVMPSAV